MAGETPYSTGYSGDESDEPEEDKVGTGDSRCSTIIVHQAEQSQNHHPIRSLSIQQNSYGGFWPSRCPD